MTGPTGIDPRVEVDESGRDYPEAFGQFLAAYAEDEKPFYLQLFEITKDEKSGRSDRAYIRSWPNEIPDFDVVASYGPGTYALLLMYHSKKKPNGRLTKTVTIKISAKYKPASQENVLFGEMAVPPMSGPAQIGGGGFMGQVLAMQQSQSNQLMQIMGLFMQTVSGMMQKRDDVESRVNGFGQMSRMLNDVIMSNVENQQIMAQKILSKRFDLPENPEENDPEPGLFGFIKDVFYRYGDQILGAAKPVQKFFAQQAQAAPEFELISQQPEVYKAACDDLIQEDPKNASKLKKILGILGAPDPAQLFQPPQEEQTASISQDQTN